MRFPTDKYAKGKPEEILRDEMTNADAPEDQLGIEPADEADAMGAAEMAADDDTGMPSGMPSMMLPEPPTTALPLPPGDSAPFAVPPPREGFGEGEDDELIAKDKQVAAMLEQLFHGEPAPVMGGE